MARAIITFLFAWFCTFCVVYLTTITTKPAKYYMLKCLTVSCICAVIAMAILGLFVILF